MRPASRSILALLARGTLAGAMLLPASHAAVTHVASAQAPTELAGARPWRSVTPELALEFPRDHGVHAEHAIEWWYLTGQLVAADGARFGYQFTIFRRGLGSGPDAVGPLLPGQPGALRADQVYFGHLAVSVVGDQRTRFAERMRRGGSPFVAARVDDLDLVLEDWSLRRRQDGSLELRAGEPALGIALALELRTDKPLVLHGNAGYSQKGSAAGNASAYTSWTRLATEGRLTLDGNQAAVTGASWFDHEFGSSVLEPGVSGWDWFGLQLDDGRELMLFQLRGIGGGVTEFSGGTLVEADGSSRTLSAREVRVLPSGAWKSPRTGASYPQGWRLEVPSAGLALDLTALLPDCEIGPLQSIGLAYWEGPVRATGSVTGRGYAELTGYAGSMEARF